MNSALPSIESRSVSKDGQVVFRLHVPTELSLFRGHFPGFPLLPGVAQIHWAARFAADCFPIDGAFSRMLNIKFQQPVTPGAALDLTLSWDADRRQLAFSYTTNGRLHASGKLEFAASNQP
ncbi:3-hydroxyacyl-ACP dehydratase FabZ family protein [Azoarcus taiwanensis]|uniref:Hydroxymyristoyl-ACP dehydratase n=1 Tax=Azoarcus taiwanensis TaxID=666964 RepID=A0A972F8U6_9RHOO|nr:hydroxymyristoyl-ACP dehydratase [Azoarcus taiwanensis]NMG03845.1 hydroxymyristoyl-ACP dehydratase [Azoarcus taiwanensis]